MDHILTILYGPYIDHIIWTISIQHIFLACPCELLCLDGCTDCENPVCQCQVIDLIYIFYTIYIPNNILSSQITLIFKERESNEEWNRCLDSNSLILGRCVYGCDGNEECKDQCVAEFEERQLNCPCEVSIELEKSYFQFH